MARVTFTARMIEGLQPSAERREYLDAAVPGLALRVSPGGAKTWALLYRVNGRRLKRWTLGRYPDLSLADARTQARAARRDVLLDAADPGARKREAREVPTLEAVAARYLTEYAKPRKRSWREDARILEADIIPAWRDRPLQEITRRDVRELLDGIVARGAPVMANRTRALVGRLFRWAIEHDLLDASPAAFVRRPAVEVSRDRVLTDDELRHLWTALDQQPMLTAAAWRLRLLTAARGGEVLNLRWADLDLVAGWWTIPAQHAKNRLSHRIPLVGRALELLRRLDAERPEADRPAHVFQGSRGKHQQARIAKAIGIADLRGHDLRRSAASRLAGLGVPREVIARLLNHVQRDPTSVYVRHGFDAEKKAALQRWDSELGRILDGPGAVLEFRGRQG